MSRYDLLPCTSERNGRVHPDCGIAHKRLALEEKMIRGLIHGLKRAGWTPVSVLTDRFERVENLNATLDAVFSVDCPVIRFLHTATGQQRCSVSIVLGNGIDCIVDWTVPHDDLYGWDATMVRITDQLAERYDRVNVA